MSETPTVTLGGVVMGGATLYDWELAEGPAPVEHAFTASIERVEQLDRILGQPTTLEIVGPRKTLTVEQVYLISVEAGSDPFERRLRVTDRRWTWPKRWVSTTFNLRRATGNKFLAGEGRLENRLLQPEIRYARYTLYPHDSPSEPWTAREALRWIVETELGVPLVFRDEPPTQVPIEDLEVEAAGDDAVSRLLTFMPGMALYVDLAGRAVVYDTQKGDEAELLQRSQERPHVSGGQVIVVDRRVLRPAKVVVLFTPEVEMRFEFREGSEGGTSVEEEDTPSLVNVAPLPDAQLEVGGVLLARSSWAPLTELFTAWGAFGLHNRQITLSDLRQRALGHGWANFEQAWGNDPNAPPDSVAAARAGTAARSWRILYRIDRYWTQRLAAIRPYRASIVNPETGAYGRAEAYCDWTRRPSHKGLAALKSQPNLNQGWAVRGYNDDLASAEPAPALVELVDEQSGVIGVHPLVDPNGLAQAMVWGYPEGGKLPSQHKGAWKRTGERLYANWNYVRLEDDFRMAVLLTVVPGSPNDLRRFHQVEVTPEEISPSPGTSVGPVVYARVFPGVMTARFGWLDGQREAIEAAVKGAGPYPLDLLLNPDLVQDVARATAARIYETLRDRPAGSAELDMDPDIQPRGTVGRVRHVMGGGATTTQIAFQAVSQPTDVWRWLNASTQRAILKTLNTPRSTGG